MVDPFPKKLEGEGMDFTHGSVYLDDPKIEYDTGNGFIKNRNEIYNTVTEIVKRARLICIRCERMISAYLTYEIPK